MIKGAARKGRKLGGIVKGNKKPGSTTEKKSFRGSRWGRSLTKNLAGIGTKGGDGSKSILLYKSFAPGRGSSVGLKTNFGEGRPRRPHEEGGTNLKNKRGGETTGNLTSRTGLGKGVKREGLFLGRGEGAAEHRQEGRREVNLYKRKHTKGMCVGTCSILKAANPKKHVISRILGKGNCEKILMKTFEVPQPLCYGGWTDCPGRSTGLGLNCSKEKKRLWGKMGQTAFRNMERGK